MSATPVIINTPENTIQSDAQDWASIFNSIIGDVSGVLDYGKKLELKKIDDNTVQLQDGIYSMQGHIIKVDKNTTENLTITSGTLGMNRLDAVVVEYEKSLDEKKNDTFDFKVIRGTPVNQGGSSPTLPQLVTQDLLSGGSKRQELLYSVLIESTEIKTIEDKSIIISNVKKLTEIINKNNEMAFNRLVPDSNGWTVIEYPNKWVEMTKLFYLSGVNLNAVNPLYARTVTTNEIDMRFPYPFQSIKTIDISPFSEYGPASINQFWWVDNIITQLDRVTNFRIVSITNETRPIRYALTIKGFRP